MGYLPTVQRWNFTSIAKAKKQLEPKKTTSDPDILTNNAPGLAVPGYSGRGGCSQFLTDHQRIESNVCRAFTHQLKEKKKKLTLKYITILASSTLSTCIHFRM